jgi:hypothetical protein
MASDRSGRQGGTREHSRYTRCWQRGPVVHAFQDGAPRAEAPWFPLLSDHAASPMATVAATSDHAHALDSGARGTPLRLPHGEGTHAYRDATARPG